jgi:Phospholipase_D-nuclease N-terminal
MSTATEVSVLTVALYLLDLAIKVIVLGLVPEGRRPSSATAWLLLILFLPVIGLVAFWLIGSPFVDRGCRRQQAAAGEVISAALTTETDDLLPVPAGSTLNTLVVLNRRLGWLPAVGGNKAELFSDYNESIAVMADVAVIGSSNMDIRSFTLDFEISVMCLSRSLTTAMRKVEDNYRSLSRELTLAEWRRRPLGKRYIDNVMRLTSTLQ